MTTNSSPSLPTNHTRNTRKGRYVSNALTTDIKVRDYVLVDRIAGYLQVDAIEETPRGRVFHGHYSNGSIAFVRPTADRCTAWLAY